MIHIIVINTCWRTIVDTSETFQAYRPLLFSIAYRMLGSASEAEDVVQDAYVRYVSASDEPIRSPKAFLSTIVSRLCLDRLKAARSTREQYIGPWLPEPIIIDEDQSAMLKTVEQRESITLAFLVLLETLSPQERAVFLLREVFEYEYAEIGAILQITPGNCRQLFHRAKTHIAEHRPRFNAAPEQQKHLVERFMAATQEGDLDKLTSLLAHDVKFQADGGGKATASRRLVAGNDSVARLMIGLTQKLLKMPPASLEVRVVMVNNTPSIVGFIDGVLDTCISFTIDNDAITAINLVRNPDKLAYVRHQFEGQPSHQM